jgi:hypothetical protein
MIGDLYIGVRQTISLNKIRSAKFEEDSAHLRIDIKCASDKYVHVEFKFPNDSNYKEFYSQDAIILPIPFNKNK